MPRRLPIIASALMFGLSVPAFANDSTAELGTGGLILSRTDAITMQKEDLFISRDEVKVDYVFRNTTDADVSTVVAFPMPDISGNPYYLPAIPNDPDRNFLSFTVTVAGKPIEPTLEQKAFAASVDVTKDLEEQGVPLYPNGDAAFSALAKLPEAVAKDWIDRGIIVVDEYDDGSGWKRVRSPYWQLRSTFWWRTVFPANKEVAVSHRYKPSVGGTAGLNFFSEGRLEGEIFNDYKAKYCIDADFAHAVLRSAKENPDGYPQLSENRISYVLTTGGNWASGSIGDFKLTIDKGDKDALVSFCGSGVRKTGPTTFEMKAKDYNPTRDIDILILNAWDWQREAPLTGKDPEGTVRRKPGTPATGNGG